MTRPQSRVQPRSSRAPSPDAPAFRRRELTQSDEPVERLSSRSVATDVVYRVCEEGAFATPALDSAILAAGLDVRDAALATQIVYGTLRVLPSLDALLAPFLRDPAGLDTLVLAALRVAVFQIRHLSRIPVHAIVSETVTLVRARRGKMSGLANAVLRKIERPEHAEPPTTLAIPAWAERRLQDSLDSSQFEAFTAARILPPPLDLRVRSGERNELMEAFLEHRASAAITAGVHAATIHLDRGGDARKLPFAADGRFVVQEQGSQIIAALLGAKDGERILDACAGHGGKSLAILDTTTDTRVTAVDLHEARLQELVAQSERLGVAVPNIYAIDWTVGDGDIAEDDDIGAGYDRVLVDAPCSGLGTIHRRPEILLRLTPNAIFSLAATQLAILRRVANLVRPGGVLLYAVCSPLYEEGGGVVKKFLELCPSIRLVPQDAYGLQSREDGTLPIGPWLDGCDGYQVAKFERLP